MEKKITSKLKLLFVNKLEDGTWRLQSQLYRGKDTADFVLQESALKNWRLGKNGLGFYPIDIPYIIVDLNNQVLAQN